MKVSRGLEYTVMKNGVAILRGIGNCLDEHIVIPSTVQSYPVVGVAEKAFARSSQIKSITLPRSVRFIEAKAFAWCRELTEISLGGVSDIGERAFMGCDKLCSLDFGKSVELIDEKAFAYCPAISSVALPDTVTRLGAATFEGCRNLCTVSLSEGIRIIENSTFYACENLRKVDLPTRLEYIDEYAFAHCISIIEINLPPRTVINCGAFFECGKLLCDGKVS